MTTADQENQDKYKKLKMGAIPLLFLILAYVLYSNIKDDNHPRLSIVKQQVKQENSHPDPASTLQKQNIENSLVLKNIKELTFAEITKHDPFQPIGIRKKPVALSFEPQPDLLEVQERDSSTLKNNIEEIKQSYSSSITGIIYSSNNKAVIINSKIYREGDLLENGHKLIAIKPDGIVVEGNADQL